MQETLEQRMARLSGVKQPETLEERMARLAAAQPQPAARPPLWDRVKDVGRAIADDPLGAAKNIGKGLVQNATDLVALTGTTRGDYQPMMRVIADEVAHGDGAGKRLAARAVGAASLGVPALRVGGVATTMLANTAANAGLGAAQTPDDPMLGATLGAVVPHVMGATGRLARTATSKLSRAVRPLETLSLDGATDDVLRGIESSQRNVIPKRRPSTGVKIQPEKIDAFAEVGNEPAVDFLLRLRSQRADEGLNAATVRPQTPRAPADVLAHPEGYQASLDAPQAEVRAVPGAKKLFVDQEVKASRVQDERIATAEQRDAEARMTKEVRALDGEAARAATQAEQDAVKAAKQAEKEQQRAANALAQEQAKAARDAEKAAATAERAAQAAAKAAKLQADAAALEAAKAVGKDAVKDVRAQQAAEKAAQRAADAQAKADFAAQAALDAQAKRALADEAAAKTVADMTPPSTETAAGMLNTANAQYNRTQRGKMAAQAALARRRGTKITPVQIEKPAPSEPSVVPDEPYVRLYRGQNAATKRGGGSEIMGLQEGNSTTGRWFTTEKDRAGGFATKEGGEVVYVDVPERLLPYFDAQRNPDAAMYAGGAPGSEFILPDEWLGKARNTNASTPEVFGEGYWRPVTPVDAPAAPVAAPLTPSNAPAIPEVHPVASAAPEHSALPSPSLPPADKPFLNWRTLGVDPSQPDVLNKSVSSRIQEKMRDPAFVDEMRAARGSTTFGAMNEEAMKSKLLQDFVADPLSLDPKKVSRLSGAEIAAIRPILRENVALIEVISRELQDGNLSADDIILAHQKIDMLEEANANTLLVVQQEVSGRGRDLGALRQVANITTDPAYWLMKPRRLLVGRPLGVT